MIDHLETIDDAEERSGLDFLWQLPDADENAMGLLAQSVGKAVETLVGLLDTGDGRSKRLAARDILDQHVKFRELDELTERIETIEERLEARK